MLRYVPTGTQGRLAHTAGWWVLAALMAPLWLDAQPRHVAFKRLATEQGPLRGTVHAVLQDRVGFVWLGTQDGLYRYDGDKATAFKHDPADSSSLSHNHVQCLYESRSGDLWIGTDAGGLNRWRRSTGEFLRYRHDPRDPDSLASNRVRSLLEDRTGALWVGTFDRGLDRIDPDSGAITHFQHQPGDPDSLDDDRALALLETRDGEIWVGTRAGLNRYDRQAEGFERFRPFPEGSPERNQVRSLLEDSRGNLWVGTYHGLARFDRANERFEDHAHDPADPTSLGGSRVRDILEDSDDRLWVATDGGLSLLLPDLESFVTYRHDPSDPTSLSTDQLVHLFQDRSGVLWVGTLGGGINTWQSASWTFSHYKSSLRDPRGLSGNGVLAFAEDRGGALWIGTLGSGLDRWQRERGRFVHYRHDPDDPTSLSGDQVTALLHDGAGVLWAGTLANGLNRYRPEDDGFVRDRHDPQRPESLAANGVMTLFEDRHGRVWIGTHGGGLDLYDEHTGTFVHHRHDPDDPESLSGDRVTALAEEASGALWVGTHGDGLNRLDPASASFGRLRHDPGDPASLSQDIVLSLHVDGDDRLWVGTKGGGLSRLDRFDSATGRAAFTHYSERDGLPNAVVYGIHSDRDGRLWMSTYNGLARFEPDDGIFRTFAASNGLQGDVFNIGAHYRSPRGELFFGGFNGFNAFFPEAVRINDTPPPVILTGFSKLNEPVDFGKPMDEVEEIELSFRDEVFSFEFAALDYTAPERNRYAYKLEGFNSDWVYLDRHRPVTYTSIDPGSYRFRVKAANNDGVWSEEGASVGLRIVPPPWRTWWAYGFYGLLAASLLAGLIGAERRKLRREERHSAELELQVAARTRELAERAGELEALNIRLGEISTTDSVTSLRNRRYLMDHMPREVGLVQRLYRGLDEGAVAPAGLAFLVIDLDLYKPINDTYGHAVGDEVLREVADILSRACRAADILVRWGGDEFVIAARGASPEKASQMAERIRSMIAGHAFDLGDGRMARLTCSIGFASYPFFPSDVGAVDWEQVITLADMALYIAKNTSKDAWVGLSSDSRSPVADVLPRLHSELEKLSAEGHLKVTTSIPEGRELVWP